MAVKGKKISEASIADSLKGDELFPFAKDGDNGAVSAETIKNYAQDGLDDKFVEQEDGKGLSSNDFTDSEKRKLVRITNYVSHIESALYYNELYPNALEIRFSKINVNTFSSTNYTLRIPAVSISSSGLMSASDKVKLDNIEDGAQVNPTYVSELINDKNYQSDEDVKNTLAGYVEKETGKSLSTEDFTTALKEKLDGLTNYDDSELDEKIEALKSRLDILVGSEDATAVIDTFKEIENFLQGITNTETLTGLLQEMKSEIVQLCANTYLPLSGGTITGTGDTPFNINTTNTTLNVIGQYYKINNVNKAWVGYTAKNNYGTVIYNSSSQKYMGINDDGTPHYQGYELWHKGNDGSGSGLDADKVDGKQPEELTVKGAYSLLAKKPWQTNSIENTADTCSINYITEVQKNTCEGIFPCSNNANSIINLSRHSPDGQSGFFSQIGFSNNGYIYYRAINTRIDTTTSWKQLAFTNGNVESANKLTTKQLTNEDLNEIKDDNFTNYYGQASNTCLNLPISGAFNLQSFKASSWYQHILITGFGVTYKRYFNSNNKNWSDWKRMLTEDDIPKTVVFEDSIDFNIREYGEDFILTGENNITAFNTIIANASKPENVNIKLKGNGIVKNITSYKIINNAIILGITIVYDNGSYSKYALNAQLTMDKLDNTQIHCVVLEGFIS